MFLNSEIAIRCDNDLKVSTNITWLLIEKQMILIYIVFH